MALIDDVRDVLNDLSEHGWRELFAVHGLDIEAEDLKKEFLKELNVNRKFPGFEDFALEGNRGITPGFPARSLIYHALASPNVVWVDANRTKELSKFPSLSQLEVVENYVYGIEPRSISFLQSLFSLSENPERIFGIVAFASQYRTAVDTPHKKHADLVYSRTGVSRVGTAPHSYEKRKRAFSPLVEDDASKMRVLPARYSSYIAVRLKGNVELLGNRFNTGKQIFRGTPPDEDLSFWYPIQKLFNGDECLQSTTLNVEFKMRHVNEKIRKIHKFIGGEFDIDPGSNQGDHDIFPFHFSDKIAQFDHQHNLVIPLASDSLVAETKETLKKDFKLRTTSRTGDTLDKFSSSLEIRSGAPPFPPVVQASTGNPRQAPEYMHIRSKVDNSQIIDLNGQGSVEDFISNESFSALHYIDFTGDGFVESVVRSDIPLDLVNVKAYSLISAPDFFPLVEQTEILTAELGSGDIWFREPYTLADTRILPNIKTHPDLIYEGMSPFDTCTALIPGILDKSLGRTEFLDQPEKRVSYLPDGAGGILAPGWDTSFDMVAIRERSVPHLAAYGLGSPFPEDAKLCAALSSFWPAVAPDITRSFWQGRPGRTVVPLLDSEIGAHDFQISWDGEMGPKKVLVDADEVLRMRKFEYVDYTLNALTNKFNFHLLASIDTIEYKERILKLSKVQKANSLSQWLLSSYTQLQTGNNELTQNGELSSLDPKVHKFSFILPGRRDTSPGDHQSIDIEILEEKHFYIDRKDAMVVI